MLKLLAYKLQRFKDKRYFKKKVSFYNHFISRNDIVFDVGANNGKLIDVFLACNAKVIAVEPQPECIEILEKKYNGKIHIIKEGLGSKKESRIMYLSNASTISTFSSEWVEKCKKDRFKEYNWDKEIFVEMTTLDELIKSYSLPKFCKIDVEGFELEVLSGLSFSIPLISFEYAIPETFERTINCIEKLISINNLYKFNFSINENIGFTLPKFVTKTEFIQIMDKSDFSNSSWGDVFASLIH